MYNITQPLIINNCSRNVLFICNIIVLTARRQQYYIIAYRQFRCLFVQILTFVVHVIIASIVDFELYVSKIKMSGGLISTIRSPWLQVCFELQFLYLEWDYDREHNPPQNASQTFMYILLCPTLQSNISTYTV